MTSMNRPPEDIRFGSEPGSGSKDVLGYLDQAFFVTLRALGRQPIIYFLWLYERPLDEASVNRFNQQLAKGSLGRLLQRSPLPWGRHRWVANHVPAPVTWYRDEVSVEHLPEWRRALVELPLDPEYGPGWRLAVQSLQGGGAALALVVSHTIADGKAAAQAAADAVADQSVEGDFPPPSWRWSPRMVVRDGVESLRALPGAWRAVKLLMNQPRMGSDSFAARGRGSARTGDEQSVVLPLAQVVLDQQACERRAAQLDIKGNTLISALAVRIAFRIGRIDTQGRVELVLPVSNRIQGDRRGNALRAVTVLADPHKYLGNPSALLEDIRGALVSRESRDQLSLLPLIPYLPLWMGRRFERMMHGRGLPVGCSLFGELPPELAHPCGEATHFQIFNLERYTTALLEQQRGGMLLIGFRLGGKVLLSIVGQVPNKVTTSAELLPHVHAALKDLGLDGHVT